MKGSLADREKHSHADYSVACAFWCMLVWQKDRAAVCVQRCSRALRELHWKAPKASVCCQPAHTNVSRLLAGLRFLFTTMQQPARWMRLSWCRPLCGVCSWDCAGRTTRTFGFIIAKLCVVLACVPMLHMRQLLSKIWFQNGKRCDQWKLLFKVLVRCVYFLYDCRLAYTQCTYCTWFGFQRTMNRRTPDTGCHTVGAMHLNVLYL